MDDADCSANRLDPSRGFVEDMERVLASLKDVLKESQSGLSGCYCCGLTMIGRYRCWHDIGGGYHSAMRFPFR